MKNRGELPRLHVLTDDTLQARFTPVELARLVAEGGADVVQYREKRPRTTAALVEAAAEIARAVRPRGTRLLVNDRVDVALAAGADGVHVGRHDLDAALARRLLGDELWLGRTANDLEEARRVAALPVDYLGIGPVFGTSSKADPAPALGVEEFRRIVSEVDLPVIAIGSLTPERAVEVLDAGAYGIAVLSDVVLARDPAERTARFREALSMTLGGEEP